MKRLALLLLLPSVALACAQAAPKPPRATELSVAPGFGDEADGLDEAWRRYAQARVAGPLSRAGRRGSPDPPSFEEEVFAREYMVRVWSELAAERGYRDRYLEELALVQAEGFLREYTWECLHVLRGIEPSGLELAAFRPWFEARLPDHRVETWVAAHSESDRVHFQVGRPAHAPYLCTGTD